MAKSLAQLNKQIATLQRQADDLKAKELKGVIARIREAIEFYGLTAADLGLERSGGRGGARKQSDPGTSPRKRTTKAGRAAALPPKYRSPDGRTWSGHGRRPVWYVEALAQGKTPEDLAV